MLPCGAQNIDFFLRNDDTLADLYQNIDQDLLPELKGCGWLDD